MGCTPPSPKRRRKPRSPSPIKDANKVKCIISTEMLIKHRKRPLSMRYQEMEIIGNGATGDVKVVKDLVSNVLKAMKTVSKKETSEILSPEGLLNEIDILKELSHPNIVKLYEYSQDLDNYYLVLDYCKGGELLEKINNSSNKCMKEEDAARIMRQIFLAVSYCHQNQVMHR